MTEGTSSRGEPARPAAGAVLAGAEASGALSGAIVCVAVPLSCGETGRGIAGDLRAVEATLAGTLTFVAFARGLLYLRVLFTG